MKEDVMKEDKLDEGKMFEIAKQIYQLLKEHSLTDVEKVGTVNMALGLVSAMISAKSTGLMIGDIFKKHR